MHTASWLPAGEAAGGSCSRLGHVCLHRVHKPIPWLRERKSGWDMVYQRKTKRQTNCHVAFSSELKHPLQMGGETHETPEVNKTSYVWGIGSWEDSQGPSPALQRQ